jgi:type IV pilus assembly protein PilM
MPGSSVCWGIEIGASAIKAMKLQGEGDDGAKVLDYAVIPHPKVLSMPGVDANDVLRVSLAALTSQYDLHKAAIAVSVPGHAGFARFAKLPPVEARKVPDIVKFEAMQQIPFPLEQVEWDYQTFVSPDSPEVEVGIFAITKERVNERLAMLAEFGLYPDYVVLSPIAVYNALAYDLQFSPQTPGTIIVDVGTTSTDLVIATPGRMWVRTFPIGGHQFTEALVNQFQLSYAKAEKLKREAEDSKHARQVFQAMRPVFTDLAQDIQRSIGYYQSINKDASLTRLIGVGSTFHLPGLRKYLKQQLSMDVYRIEEFRRASVEGSRPGDERSQALNAAALTLCTAYGLGLHGLGLNAVGCNLMPVSVLRKAAWKEKVPWFGMAAGVAVLAGGIMFINPLRDYFDVKGEAGNPPAIIASAVRAAEANKAAANEAGVTSAGEADYRLANIAALSDAKGVMTQIVADVSAICEEGNRLAARWAKEIAPPGGPEPAIPSGPAFTVRRITTTYEPPLPENAELMGYGISPQDDPLGLSRQRRIRCVVELSTSMPEASRFVDRTIGPWLKANARRPGVAYEIRSTDRPTHVGQPGRQDVPAPARIGAEGGPGAVRTGGRGVMPGVVPPDEGMVPPERVRIDPRLFRLVGEGGPPPAESAAVANEFAALDDLNKIAPIQPVTPPEPATATVTVTFWAVFPEGTSAEGGAK